MAAAGHGSPAQPAAGEQQRLLPAERPAVAGGRLVRLVRLPVGDHLLAGTGGVFSREGSEDTAAKGGGSATKTVVSQRLGFRVAGSAALKKARVSGGFAAPDGHANSQFSA